MTDTPSPLMLYRQAIEQHDFHSDPAQWQAAQSLEDCHHALHTPQEGPPRIPGIYLWGPVGRGKTWLMDSFYRSLRVPARRQHFHHFMRWVHQRLFQLTGTPDPLQALARELSEEVRVLCFDELFVSDIADAMLLGRLLRVMFEEGVVLVATSNQPPQQLYAEGYNRERFLPAVEAIERHMRIVSVDGGQDHRLHPGAAQQRYWVRDSKHPSALPDAFATLVGERPVERTSLELNGRRLQVMARSETVLWTTFAALCDAHWASQDYIALCDRFTAILLGDVPALGGQQQEGRIARGTEDAAEQVRAGDRILPALARSDDAVRRFIALVDECYDRGVPLYLEAEVEMKRLYVCGYLMFPFRRTLSRLTEMQMERFASSAL